MCSPARDVIEEEKEEDLEEEEASMDPRDRSGGGLSAEGKPSTPLQYRSARPSTTKPVATGGNPVNVCGPVGSHVTVTSSKNGKANTKRV